MKNSIALLIALLAVINLNGQSFIEKYYSDIEQLENTTSIHVSPGMFNLISQIDDSVEKDEEIEKIISSTTSFSLIKTSDYANAKSTFTESVNRFEGDYDELVRIKDGKERFLIYVDESNDVIHEIAVLGYVDSDFLAISIFGKFALEDVSKAVEYISKNENSSLSVLRSTPSYDVNVYPNPVVQGGKLMVDIPENLIGANGEVYDINGAKLLSFTTKKETNSIDTSSFPSGTYNVQLTKGELSVKRKFIVIE